MLSQTTEGQAHSCPDAWPSTVHALQQHGIPRQSVEAVHLPSTLQETMIMSTSMDPRHRLYMETYHFTTSHPIDPSLLDSTLHALASKHSTLRTIICWNKDHPGPAVSLVVLDAQYMHRHGRLLWSSTSPNADGQQFRVKFQIHGRSGTSASIWDGEMPWKASVAPIPNTNQYRFTLSYHHAIMDGTSVRQLLCWIREEMERPGSVTEKSDFMSMMASLSTWRSLEVRMRLCQRYESIQQASVFLEDRTIKGETEVHILSRRISTEFDHRFSAAAVPAWLGRLALSLALCAFQRSHESVFYETMSARRFLSPSSHHVLGPLLVTQPRVARFQDDISLEHVAQTLRSSTDIPHGFTSGELLSFVPAFRHHLPVAFICQTDASYPWNGVGDWDFDMSRETMIDMPLILELMPQQQGSFFVHLHYHQHRFSKGTMSFLHEFICDALIWLQTVHTSLADHTFHGALAKIRAHNADVDHYLRSIEVRIESNSGNGVSHNHVNGTKTHSQVHINGAQNGPETSQPGDIEFSTIESSIMHHSAVQSCSVINGYSNQGRTLLALVEISPSRCADWEKITIDIRSHCIAVLPSRMVPSHLIQVTNSLSQMNTSDLKRSQQASNPDMENVHEDPTARQDAHLQYWTSQLENSQPAELLYDWHPPKTLSGLTRTQKISVPSDVYCALREYCESSGVSPLVILLACFRAAHYRMTQVYDGNIGAFLPNGTSDLPLCIRSLVEDTDSFEELVQHVQFKVKEASQHADIPLERIASVLGRTAESSLVRSVIKLHSSPNELDEKDTRDEPPEYGLEVHLCQQQDSMHGFIRYSCDLYAAPTIRVLQSVFSELLQRGLQTPQCSITTISLTHGQQSLEDMGLLDLQTCAYPRDASIVGLFKQEVASHPQAVAVKDACAQLTYDELDRTSDFLADWLRTRQLAPETPVAIFAARSCEAIVAIMGILKANLAYVPLDHQWPDSRIQTILSSLGVPRVLLLGANVRIPDMSLDDLDITSIEQAVELGSQLRVPPVDRQWPSPTSLAYIIFTSGSTGQPKGVMIEHRSVVCRVRPSTHMCTHGTSKTIAHMASLAFDAATWEIYTALLNGGTILCIDSMTVLDYPALNNVFAREAIRVAFITPALLKECIAACPEMISHLDSLVVGGERSDPQTFFQTRRLLGSGEFVHAYGPTENTIYSTRYRLPIDERAVNGVPIGSALPESGAYVMDTEQSLVPLGVQGELVLTGDGLARGYTDPERNQNRFIQITLDGKSIRAYRTGDRVRRRPGDGAIEFFGRMDNQVKIRGNRMELGEIELALANQVGVDEAIVIVQQDHTNNDQQLVAFVTESNPTSQGNGLAQQLRKRLREQLPSYMVPAVIHILDRMPINHNGKVDRRVLAQMEVAPAEEEPIPDNGPRSVVEEVVCQQFSRALGCNVRMGDNFYDLGGHSLMGTRAIVQIAQKLECQLSIRDLINNPTPESLVRHVASLGKYAIAPAKATSLDIERLPPLQLDGWEKAVRAMGLDPDDVQLAMPCSPFQQGVLSVDAAMSGQSGYRAIVHLTFNGLLHIDALRVAWRELVAREEMLRTVFLPVVQAGSKQGIAGDSFVQIVLRPDCAEVQRVSTIGDGSLSNHVTTSDLGMGSVPLSLNFAPGASPCGPALVLSIHHALYDGAYLSCIIARLSEVYCRVRELSAVIAPEHGDIPFSSFIRKLQCADLPQMSSFWRSYLKDAPVTSWPIAGPLNVSNKGQLPRVESIRWKGDVRKLARKFHTTPAAIARAAVALVTAVHGNNEDVVLGEVSTGRHQSSFVAGPCIATHPVRIRLNCIATGDQGCLSFEGIVKATMTAYADTMPHQQLGLAEIRRETDHPAQMPFQVLYVYQQSSKEPSQVTDCMPQFSLQISNSGRVDFPLVIEAFCDEATGDINFQCTYDPTALPPMDAHWVMQHLRQALQTMETNSGTQPFSPFSSLSNCLLGLDEKAMVERFSTPEGWSKQEDSHALKCVHETIQEQARKTPEKIALRFEQTEFATYRQLDVWSTNLSHAIRSVLHEQMTVNNAFEEQPLIPICFDKSIDMVVTILAVLKAGAAYVPLDIEHPVDRLSTICQAINTRILIWDGVNGGTKLHTVCYQIRCSLWSVKELRQVEVFPALHPVSASPNDLAYVLFTSGSTGTPKGVMVEHRNLSSFMESCVGSNDCSWTSNRLALLAYTFDASLGDLFGVLGKGGRLSLVRRETLIPDLSKHLDELAVSHLALTPTLGALLLNQAQSHGSHLAHLRTLVFGGEPFRPQILDLLPEEMTVWNGYGPTETAIEVTACRIQSPVDSSIATDTFLSIGMPTNKNSVHILHPGIEDPVPIGGVGELCITGPQVSRGYLNRPDLTSQQFVPSPFGPGMMYRTGDLARWHGNGSLECLGRMDHQIKLRGLRIELGEITMAAESHPSVKECVVTKVQCNGSEALVAVVVVETIAVLQNDVSATEISKCIMDKVPEYMVPAQVHIRTEPFPLTPNGKLDFRSITNIAEEEYQRRLAAIAAEPTRITRAAPNSVEVRIAKHWANMLGLDEETVDIMAPFSQLGGDSIRAITLLAALRHDGLSLNMSDLRLSATIRTLADKVRESSGITGSTHERPEYLHSYMCESSTTIVVLVHPFLGQSRVLEPLVPFLNGQFNVILVDDPFFGTPQCPESLTVWAEIYLRDVILQLPETHRLILGGYSFGGLIAMEMAMLWKKQRGSYPASLLLLDPGTYAPTDLSCATEYEKRETAEAALSLLGIEQRAMASFEEHYHRHNQVLGKTRTPPVYDGNCLYLTLPERLGPGSIADWWQRQCPHSTMHCINCDDHYALLREPSLAQVGRFVYEHCCLSVKE